VSEHPGGWDADRARSSACAAERGALAKFADLNMLMVPGGQERTRKFAALFAASCFRLTTVIDAGPRISIIEGEPA